MERVVHNRASFNVPLTLKEISGQTILDVDLAEIDLAGWCLALCLLKENLVKTIFLTGSKRLGITQSNRKELQGRATLNLTSNPLALSISATELDYWLAFFLKYYRDGEADVDHLDIEAEILPQRRETAYVTLHVKDARPRVSAEEAKKILGGT